MNILIHDYAGHPFPVQLSRNLVRRGHAVTHAFAGGLVTPRGVLRRGHGDSDKLIFREVHMSPYYRANKYNFIKRRGYEVDYGKELVRLVAEVKPDVILSGNTPTEPQWKFMKAAHAAGVPFVSWVQDFYSIAVDELARARLPLIGILAGKYYRYLDAQCLAQSAGVVAITEDFVPILLGFGVDIAKIETIPNWAPMDEIDLRPKFNSWSRRQGFDNKFVFLYSGTLAMKHNPDLLLCLAKYFKDDASVRVVVISEGPGADYLRERKRDERIQNLELLPFQSFGDMPEVFGSADVLVAILEREAGVFSVPSKVLSYHAAGRAILAAIPSENLAARIINCQSSGICVEPDDFKKFINCAVEMRTDFNRRDQFARNARNYAEKEFDINRISDDFERIFKRVVILRRVPL